MTDQNHEDGTLAHHLAYLAATADDVAGYLNEPRGGEIHPEALAQSEHLATSIKDVIHALTQHCLLYTSPSPRDKRQSRMPSSA